MDFYLDVVSCYCCFNHWLIYLQTKNEAMKKYCVSDSSTNFCVYEQVNSFTQNDHKSCLILTSFVLTAPSRNNSQLPLPVNRGNVRHAVLS